MDKDVTFSASNSEIYLLTEIIKYKIEHLSTRQDLLIEKIYEARRKIMFSSLGHKYGSLRGWHKVDPYINDKDIKIAGREASSDFGQLILEFEHIKSLCKIHNQITDGDSTTEKIYPANLNEKMSMKLEESLLIFKNFGHSLTKEEFDERIKRIYYIWQVDENNQRRRFNEFN